MPPLPPRPPLWYPLVILILTLAAYAPALRAGFIWDDDAYLTHNPTLTAPDALRRIWFTPRDSPQYYPMVFTVLYVERALWGFSPTGFHAVNIFLHGASAIFLWLTLRRLKLPGAMVAGLIFALHPVAAESVAWVTELKNTLAGFLAMATVYMYLPFGLAQGQTRGWGRYGAALALFILAMLSKTVACGVAPVLLLILWWKRGHLTPRDLLPLVPFFLIGALLGWNTAHIELDHVGATGADFALNAGDRILLAGRAAWFYAAKDLWPTHLAFFYPRWGLDVRVWWQWLYPAAAVAFLLILFVARQRIGRGPFAAAAAFVALLFPALGFFNFYPMVFSYVADHFQYLALMVFAAAAATLGARLTARWKTLFRGLLTAAVVGPLGILTALSAAHYQSPWTLWSSLAAENQHWMGLQGMSGILLQQAADEHRRGATGARVRPLIDRVFALNRQLEAQRPDRGEIHNNNAQAWLLLGDLDQAYVEATTATKLAPHMALGYETLAAVLQARHDLPAAIAALRQAIAAEPLRAQPHSALGDILFQTGEDAAAETELQQAATLGPSVQTWEALGYLRSVRGNYPAACDAYRRALQIDPDWVPALDGLARATALDPAASPEDLTAARAAAQTACRLSPQAMHLDTLGMVRWRTGDAAGALAAATTAFPLASPDERPIIQRHLALYGSPATKP